MKQKWLLAPMAAVLTAALAGPYLHADAAPKKKWSPSPSPTASATPAASPTPSPALTPSPTPTPAATATATPAPSATATPTPSVSATAAPTPAVSPTPAILGYYVKYYSTDMNSYNSLSHYTASYINQISTATYSVAANGTITGATPTEGVQLALNSKDQAFACLQNTVNGAFSSSLAHTIITDPALRAAFIQSTLNLLKTYGYTGANMDFEDMPAADRPYYNTLIQEMSVALHDAGYKLVVSVPGKTSDSPTAAWSGTFEYAALGRYADAIQLMTYDQNGPWGAPGPVSGLPWVENVVKYAVTQIPAAKVMIGLPAYGYDWNTTTNTGHKAVMWKSVPNLIATTGAVPQYDAVQQSPWFTYTAAADGSKHTVWYENSTSIAAKSALVKKYGLAGVSVWRLGMEDESFWKAVQTGMAP